MAEEALPRLEVTGGSFGASRGQVGAARVGVEVRESSQLLTAPPLLPPTPVMCVYPAGYPTGISNSTCPKRSACSTSHPLLFSSPILVNGITFHLMGQTKNLE